MENNKTSISAKIAAVLSVAFVVFHVYTALFGVLPGIGQKSVHLGLLMIIFYVREIAGSKKVWYKALCTLMLAFAPPVLCILLCWTSPCRPVPASCLPPTWSAASC